jgi:hypothetical protein
MGKRRIRLSEMAKREKGEKEEGFSIPRFSDS